MNLYWSIWIHIDFEGLRGFIWIDVVSSAIQLVYLCFDVFMGLVWVACKPPHAFVLG